MLSSVLAVISSQISSILYSDKGAIARLATAEILQDPAASRIPISAASMNSSLILIRNVRHAMLNATLAQDLLLAALNAGTPSAKIPLEFANVLKARDGMILLNHAFSAPETARNAIKQAVSTVPTVKLLRGLASVTRILWLQLQESAGLNGRVTTAPTTLTLMKKRVDVSPAI